MEKRFKNEREVVTFGNYEKSNGLAECRCRPKMKTFPLLTQRNNSYNSKWNFKTVDFWERYFRVFAGESKSENDEDLPHFLCVFFP